MSLSRTILVITAAWLGAAAIALVVSLALDAEGVSETELESRLNAFVSESDLEPLATDSDIRTLTLQVTQMFDDFRALGTDPLFDLSEPAFFLRVTVADLVLTEVAQDHIQASWARTNVFASATTPDYDSCLDWLSPGGVTLATAGQEACDRVRLTAFAE